MVQISADNKTKKVLERKRLILEAASQAFREKGFHATGMRDIAARLGMTVGNLYYYFKNKEDLLAFCQDETLSRLTTLVDEVQNQSLRADTRLWSLVRGHVACLNTGCQGSLAHLEVPSLEGGDHADLFAKRDRYEAALREILQEGVDEGVFGPCDTKVAVLAILGAVNWTVRWFRPGGERSASSIGGEFADHLVRGLLAPGVELKRGGGTVSQDSSERKGSSR